MVEYWESLIAFKENQWFIRVFNWSVCCMNDKWHKEDKVEHCDPYVCPDSRL